MTGPESPDWEVVATALLEGSGQLQRLATKTASVSSTDAGMYIAAALVLLNISRAIKVGMGHDVPIDDL